MLSQINSSRYFIPSFITVLVFLCLLLIRAILRRYWKTWNQKNPHPFSPRALALTRIPSIYWCLAIALHFGIELSDLPSQQALHIEKIIRVTIILSVFNALSQIAVMACKAFLARSNGLLLGLIRGTFVVLGILISLSVFGISVAPILTALGVGGVAVALALKDTLENLFAGLYLLSEGALKVGDFIRVEGGQEGTILDIGWRTTKVKNSQSNALLIPNSKLSQSLVTNFNLPDNKVGISLPVLVGVKANLNQVETVLMEIIKKSTEDIAGIINSPESTVVFLGLQTDGNLLFSLNFAIQNIKNQTQALSELRKRIFRALVDNNIPLPQTDPRISPRV